MVSRFVAKTAFMPSAGLEVHQNWELTARHPLPKNLTLPKPFKLQTFRPRCVVLHHPNINPSHGLGQWHTVGCKKVIADTELHRTCNVCERSSTGGLLFHSRKECGKLKRTVFISDCLTIINHITFGVGKQVSK